jgi:hypothetical protein
MKTTISRIIVPIFLILMSGVWCSGSLAYKASKTENGELIKWGTNTVAYYVNTSGGPAGCLAAIQAAMKTWTDVPSSSFRFMYGGHATSTAYNINDGVNIICFRKMGNKANVARNFIHHDASGKICDSDIVFNTDHKFSATDACPKNCYDIQNVLTHELGHSLSLNELKKRIYADKTMYWKEMKGETKKRSLDMDDIEGIAFLYP